jgi:hypothetical protein
MTRQPTKQRKSIRSTSVDPTATRSTVAAEAVYYPTPDFDAFMAIRQVQQPDVSPQQREAAVLAVLTKRGVMSESKPGLEDRSPSYVHRAVSSLMAHVEYKPTPSNVNIWEVYPNMSKVNPEVWAVFPEMRSRTCFNGNSPLTLSEKGKPFYLQLVKEVAAALTDAAVTAAATAAAEKEPQAPISPEAAEAAAPQFWDEMEYDFLVSLAAGQDFADRLGTSQAYSEA